MSRATVLCLLLALCLFFSVESKQIRVTQGCDPAKSNGPVPCIPRPQTLGAGFGGPAGFFSSWGQSKDKEDKGMKVKDLDVDDLADADDISFQICVSLFGDQCWNPEFQLGLNIACCDGKVKANGYRGKGSWKTLCEDNGCTGEATVALSRRSRKFL